LGFGVWISRRAILARFSTISLQTIAARFVWISVKIGCALSPHVCFVCQGSWVSVSFF
jgi:hypothetical protein